MRIKRYSPSTISQVEYIMRRFLAYAHERGRILRDITPDDLDAFRLYLVDADFAAQSVARFMEVIRRFFEYLEETRTIFMNPARDLIVKRPSRPLLYVPSEEDVKILLAQPDVTRPLGLRDRAYMELVYSTGARCSEAFSRTVFDLDLHQKTFRVMGKGAKERIVPVGKHALLWMRRYLKKGRPALVGDHPDRTALWVSSLGEPLTSPQIFKQVMAKYCKAAGIRLITPHALRRACATHMLRHGAHPVQIQFLLGHARLKTLGQYLRVTVTDLKAMHRKSRPGG